MNDLQMDHFPLATEDSTNEQDNFIVTTDSYLRQEYLSKLQEASVVPLKAGLKELSVGKNLRLFRLNSLEYSSDDDFTKKISNIYSALSQFDCCQVMILDSDGCRTEIYLGVESSDIDNLSVQFDTFKGSFIGNFPGGKISVLNVSKNEELLNRIFDDNIKISSVSAMAESEKDNGPDIYGIERLVDGMYGKPFTMILIADSMSGNDVWQLRHDLEYLYTQLSPYKNYSISINTNESRTYGESFNLTKSESVSEGQSTTENSSFGQSLNSSVSEPDSQNKEMKQAKNQVIGAVASLAAVVAGFGGQPANLLSGLFYGSGISNAIGAIQTISGGADQTKNKTSGETKNYNVSFSEAETTTIQKGFSASKGLSESSSEGEGKTIQVNCENKSISDLLEVLDVQIKKVRKIEGAGGFRCAAYFITGDSATAITAANMYRSLLCSGNGINVKTAVNVWSDKNTIDGMCSYLKLLNHPLFHFEKKVGYPVFSASTIASAAELPMYISLPRKSMIGITSSPHAEFAREVMSAEADEGDGIEIGNIYHMGKNEQSKVYLSKNSMRGHMFVTGSTGSGKSNFSYGLLKNLYDENIRFMVIEPAKGEYYKVFGGFDNVNVFGTNPMMGIPLLRINPFSFPDNVHINEHIDRLLEIFNSCWPMYAAMPAVLKDAVESIYKKCGYNMITGAAGKGSRFPTFGDLLDILPKVIKRSEFSNEVQGNYIGSLVTRVKSLTNGLYACIFTDKEIDNSILFDENTIIDLSRVGSGETKSLLMGILLMKLQEYRMSKNDMNVPLKHVTLLEEAHHLLRANTGSSAEGVNLRAMSLEMITNAIAEMRTYGEGFIIADQSPALMDPAVIRNTNTKVVFKLQENADRKAIGPALALTDEQIAELSRLHTGVAAVYQSNWDNAVLSKINYFDEKNYRPYKGNFTLPAVDNSQVYSQCLAIVLKGFMKEDQPSSADVGLCREILEKAEYADESVKKYLPVIKEFVSGSNFYIRKEKVYAYVDSILHSEQFMNNSGNTESLSKWDKRARAYISDIVGLNDAETTESILRCLELRSHDSNSNYRLYYRYIGYLDHVQNGRFEG